MANLELTELVSRERQTFTISWTSKCKWEKTIQAFSLEEAKEVFTDDDATLVDEVDISNVLWETRGN